MISSWDVSFAKNRGIQREQEEEENGMDWNVWELLDGMEELRERENKSSCALHIVKCVCVCGSKLGLLCVKKREWGKMAMGNDSKRSWK